ncbi:MAG TPA: RNA-binding protein [Acidimicrobiia bacterium]|nr:RNA-binding protein [Acidimicrobiia bacterium]
MKLYVGNLPFRTTSEDLAAAFRRFGEVESAQVLVDRDTGRSRGFGFVEMNDDDARRAIDEMDGADLAGRRIVVNESRPMAPRPPRPGGGGGGGNDRYRDR